jgi:hypothetical protein
MQPGNPIAFARHRDDCEPRFRWMWEMLLFGLPFGASRSWARVGPGIGGLTFSPAGSPVIAHGGLYTPTSSDQLNSNSLPTASLLRISTNITLLWAVRLSAFVSDATGGAGVLYNNPNSSPFTSYWLSTLSAAGGIWAFDNAKGSFRQVNSGSSFASTAGAHAIVGVTDSSTDRIWVDGKLANTSASNLAAANGYSSTSFFQVAGSTGGSIHRAVTVWRAALEPGMIERISRDPLAMYRWRRRRNYHYASAAIIGSGGGSVSIHASGTAKVAVVGSGGGVVHVSAAGTGTVKVQGAGGGAIITLAASGAGVIKVVAAGAGAITVLAAGSGAIKIAGAGSGAITIHAAGAAVIPVVASGGATITIGAAGSAAVKVTGAGSGAIAIHAAGAAIVAIIGSGGGIVVIHSAGTAIIPVVGAGGAAIAVQAAGSAVIPILGTGGGAISVGGSGTIGSGTTGTGGGAVVLHGAGVATVTVVAHGTGFITLAAAGIGLIPITGHGGGTAAVRAAGTAKVVVNGIGVGVVHIAAAGTGRVRDTVIPNIPIVKFSNGVLRIAGGRLAELRVAGLRDGSFEAAE